MQKSQIATNRKQKASSAVTLKASHLTVISNTGNRPMENSTAVNQNNQVDQAYNTASEALDAITQAMEFFGGLDALFKSIWLQTKDKPQLNHLLHAAKLGSYVCNDFFNSLDLNKIDLQKHLHELGGVSYE